MNNTPINDGGPAFPIPDSHHANGQVQYGANGMSLLDYFAGQALAGLIIAAQNSPATRDDIAAEAYRQAESLLAVRDLANAEARQRGQ